ncbi:MAG TPA: Ig-like domain-containing protein [Verrucomicrobiae bacterium]|nr:Ig-like domain-containing protein [Verrucomicrobiae bacterium]
MKLSLPSHGPLAVLASLLLTSSFSRAQDSGSVTNPPLVVVVAPDPTALEGTSSGAFTLIRYGSTDADLAVNVQLSGSASNGVDYATIGNVITIPAGSLATDIKVDPILDTVNRGNKTVILAVETNSNYRIGEHHWAAVKIIDDAFDLLPPSITLTAPTNNSAFTNPPSITLSADVTDADVTVRSVSFYANDYFLGRATNSPYSLVWSNPPAGHFSLFARAVDQLDRSALSAPVHVTVTRFLPVVTLTGPTNGANFLIHQNISLSADASDPTDGDTIASVSFYANQHLLGTATTAPYSLVWSNAPAGLFELRAVATDSSGDKGYSKPVFINVSPFKLKRLSK